MDPQQLLDKPTNNMEVMTDLASNHVRKPYEEKKETIILVSNRKILATI